MTDEGVSHDSADEATTRSLERPTGKRRHALIAPLVIVLLGLVLYLPGINWGLPGTVSWSQDTIAGFRTLGAVADWPDDWKGRYPPLQYLVLYAAYKPVLAIWRISGGAVTVPETGDWTLEKPYGPKIGLLHLIARIISVAMAIAAALGIRSAVRELTSDELAADLAAVTLMIGAAFTYFAHLGNVDVPSICWFAWSVYFYARALRSPGWWGCALLGLFASLAMSTKDALAGVYPGMAVVLLVVEIRRLADARSISRAIVSALFQPRWLVGLVVFAVPYLWLNGVFSDPGPYLDRMRYWLDSSGDTLHARQHRYANQFYLFLATIHYAAGAVGWAMLAAMVASVVYTVRRHTRIALIVLAPALSYYVIVIARVDFVYSRFLFAPLALAGVLVGLAGAAMWRAKGLPEVVRWGVPVAVFVVSLGYAIAVDLEMTTDSRYAAEEWFEENVERPSLVAVFWAYSPMPFRAQYLPRLHELGYAAGVAEMEPEALAQLPAEYLILTSYNYEDFDEERKRCKEELVRGRLGFDPVATFTGRYLGTGSSWLSLSGWGTPVPGKISPTIIVLKRGDQ